MLQTDSKRLPLFAQFHRIFELVIGDMAQDHLPVLALLQVFHQQALERDFQILRKVSRLIPIRAAIAVMLWELPFSFIISRIRLHKGISP